MDIYQEYVKMAKRAVEFSDALVPEILKTDAQNDGKSDYPLYPVISLLGHYYVVDIDDEIIWKAQKKFPDILIQHDDIRELKISNDCLDCILDMSTIDHIPEYPAALDEYERVLAPKGVLLIVVWLDNEFQYKPSPTDAGQYCFPKNDFLQELQKRFEIIELEQLAGVLGGLTETSVLTRFLCRKKGE